MRQILQDCAQWIPQGATATGCPSVARVMPGIVGSMADGL
jgi:hypothetical protein